uniref:Uncharacterized protein n=1 Tax=Rhizophora mucronata TaxID=61149 RepID=A0A2P2PAR6_RHIMU
MLHLFTDFFPLIYASTIVSASFLSVLYYKLLCCHALAFDPLVGNIRQYNILCGLIMSCPCISNAKFYSSC